MLPLTPTKPTSAPYADFIEAVLKIPSQSDATSLTGEVGSYGTSNETIHSDKFLVYPLEGGGEPFSIRSLGPVSLASPEVCTSDRAGCAVLVGESHLFSILPQLQARGIKHIFQFDLDQSVLANSERIQQIIIESTDMQSCYDTLHLSYSSAIDVMQLVGSQFFLSSAENFQKTKIAIREVSIHRLNLDIVSYSQMLCMEKFH